MLPESVNGLAWKKYISKMGGERWNRMCMGLTMSPYCSMQALAPTLEAEKAQLHRDVCELKTRLC